MTIDRVVALLGQPGRIVDLGSKKIYMYPSQKLTFINGKFTPGEDSSEDPPSTAPNLLVYESGLGVLILGAAGFLFMRSRRPAGVVPPGPPPPMAQAARPPEVQASQPPPPPAAAAAPVNLIQRLDELEKLKERGILTPEEFEREKAKLRSL